MPQVPFSGAPTVTPSLSPTPRYTADTPPAAFGVNVANAIQTLGKTADGVGNEIFARGVAMQDLYNHSEAQDADAAYMQKAGELHADFSAKEGKDAVDAYPKYIQDLQQARSDIRDGLSNGMAQKLFDSQSLSTMGRTIFNGAGHAAVENKRYAIGASQARVNAMSDQALSQPSDDHFQDMVQDTEDEIRAQGQLKGLAPEAVDEAVAQQTSKLWGQRISGLARTQPLAAQKMLDAAVKEGDVRGEDIAKLTNLVQSANHTVGARMISHQVNTGADNRWGAGIVDIKSAANAIGTFESGNNYGSIGVQTSHGRALGKYQVTEENLPEFLVKAGLPPMTANEFLANHSAQDQVFSAVFGGYMKQTGNFNDAASMWFSGKPVAQAGGVKDANGTSVPAYVSQTNAILAKNATLAQKTDMGQRIAAEQAPDDPLMQDYVRDRIAADYNKQLAVRRDDEFANRQVIETALMGGQSGKLPTTVEELTADPQAAQAWASLEPQTQRRYLGVLARQAKGDHNWNDQSLREYQILKGEAQTDPAAFLDRDVLDNDLPNSAKRELINLQGKIKQAPQGDPRVGRALGILAPDMQAAGITKKDPDDYKQFVGVLADQLQQFAEDNKRPPKVEEVKTIGARLMQAQTQKGWLWNSQSPTWQVPVPRDEADKIKSDPQWSKLGITPTDAQIQRIYTRKLYQELYGGASKAQGQSASANGPQVPVSE